MYKWLSVLHMYMYLLIIMYYVYNICIGIVYDGWNHPINIIPLLILVVCVIFGGAPRSFTSVWALINAAFIHMWMDG